MSRHPSSKRALNTLSRVLLCSIVALMIIPGAASAARRAHKTRSHKHHTHVTYPARTRNARAAHHHHHHHHSKSGSTGSSSTGGDSTGSGSTGSGSTGSGSTGSGSTGSGSKGGEPPKATEPPSEPPKTTPPPSEPPKTTEPPSEPPKTTEPEPPLTGELAPAFPGGGRPFAATSGWNEAIGSNPTLDPNSSTIAGYLGSEQKAFADLYEYGNPVFEADSSSPEYHVTCTENWGTCPLSVAPIRIPTTAAATSGSDGAMIVIDWGTRTGYDFWRARKTSAGWSASWGTKFSLDGTGSTEGATGAGDPLLAGLIRTYEIQRGHINHALTFSTNNACSHVYRYPASKTDGSSSRSNCIPEGARVQLDPTINVDAIPGITPGEKAVAHALQQYGAYANNNGGGIMAFGFQDPVGQYNPYPAAGLKEDYYDMPHIPWNHLRVLRQWNGA